MADSLKIRVSLELDAMETGNDLAKQINNLNIEPIKVGLKLDPKKVDLSALNKVDFSEIKNRFSDIFEIDGAVIKDLKESMNSIERIINTNLSTLQVAKLDQLAESLSDLGRSFKIDANALNQFEKLNTTLTEFNKLSKEAQDALIGKNPSRKVVGNLDDISNEVSKKFGVSSQQLAQSIKEANEDLRKSFDNIAQSQIKSATKYLDVQDGIAEVVRKKWNDWTDLTETTFTDGTKLGKMTANVETYLNKIEKQYESVTKSIRENNVKLHKAMTEGDLVGIGYYESIIKDFESLKKKMVADVNNSPFADELNKEFSRIDNLNKRVQDFAISQYDSGVLEKKQKEYLNKIESFADKIVKLNKEINKAKGEGLVGEYTKTLVADMTKAKTDLSNYLDKTVKEIFPDDIKARIELKKKATDIIEAMDDANNLYQAKMDEKEEKKLQKSNLNKFLEEYKKNVNEIESLGKKLATALDNGQLDYASNLQAEITALKERQQELKENAKALTSYKKAMESVAEVEEKSRRNTELHNSYLENRNKIQQQQADKKAEEKLVQEESAKRDRELKDIQNKQKQYWEDMLKHQDIVAKGYEQVTKTLTDKQNKYIEALSEDSTEKAKGLQESIKYWKEQKDNLLREINNSKFTSDFYNQIKDIDKRNDLTIGEFESSLADSVRKDSLKELVNEYSKNAKKISQLKKELLSTDEDGKAYKAIDTRIKALQKEQRDIKKSIQEYENYEGSLNKITKLQKELDANNRLTSAKNVDKIAKQEGKTEEEILNKIVKEREKLARLIEKEQTSVIDAYEKYAKLVAGAEKQYLTAVLSDDNATAEALEKVIARYEGIRNNLLQQINDKGLNNLFKDRLDTISQDINLDLNVHSGKLSDKQSKSQLKEQLREDSKALKEYVDEYDRLYKQISEEKLKIARYDQKGESINSEAHKNNLDRLKEELKQHELTVNALNKKEEALKEVAKINKFYDNRLELGNADVDQKIQISSYKTFKKEQDELVSRYKQLYQEKERFEKAMSTAVDTTAYEKLKRDLEEIGNKLTEVRSKITSQDHLGKIEVFDADKVTAQGREITQSITKIKAEAQSMIATVNELKNSEYVDKSSLALLEVHLNKLATANLDATQNEVRELNTRLTETKNLLSHLQGGIDNNIFQSNKAIELDKINDAIAKFKKDFQGVLSESSFEALENSARRLASVMDRDSFSQGARELTSQLKHARNQMDGLVRESNKYNFFEDLYTNMRTYQLGDLIVDGIQNALYSVKDIVISIDSAMANVKKVANPIDVNTIDKLESVKSQAINISKEVGMASEDVINSISDTIQSGGYAMQEAVEIARQTMMLANVGEMSAENATKGVVSMLAGFKLDPLKQMQVEVDGVTKKTNELTNAMDMVNHVGNNFAISTEGIINAMQGGATVLNSYGVGMEETIALITGANRTLQDPTVVGNGLKSIAINMAGIKADAYTGELALNKTALTLKEIAGIDVFEDKDKTKVKDMVDILDELYDRWGDFTEVEQRGLSEAIAGM